VLNGPGEKPADKPKVMPVLKKMSISVFFRSFSEGPGVQSSGNCPTGIRTCEYIWRHIAWTAGDMVKPAFTVYRKIARIGQVLSPSTKPTPKSMGRQK